MLSGVCGTGSTSSSNRKAVRRVYLKDSLGNISSAIDGVTTPTNYAITVPVGKVYTIYALTIYVCDDTPPSPDYYRPNTELTNGVDLVYTQGGDSISLLGESPLIMFGQWQRYGTLYRLEYGGALSCMSMQMDLREYPIELRAGESITFAQTDDITDITTHDISCLLDISDA